jgi:hypothetical protein
MSDFFSNKRNLYTVIGLTAVVIVGSTVAITFALIDNEDDTPPSTISKEEKEEVLSEVIKNNPKGLIEDIPVDSVQNNDNDDEVVSKPPVDSNSPNSNSPIPTPSISQIGPVDDTIVGLVVPDLDVYNYRETETTTTIGGAVGVCSLGFPVDQVGDTYTEEYKEFFDRNHSYFKYVNSDFEDELDNYNLALYGNDVNELYSFVDGQYAVEQLYDIDPNFDNSYAYENPSYPVSTPVSYPDPNELGIWESLYDSVDIIEKYEEGGVVYYIVEAFKTYPCDDGIYSDIVYYFTVDGEDYNIIESQAYVDRKDSSNLIYELKAETTREAGVLLEDVEDEFNFELDYSVPVKTVNYRDYSYDPEVESQNIIDYLDDANFVMLVDEDAEIQSLFGKDFPERVENERFYYDLDYYRVGSTIYTRIEALLKQSPLLAITYRNTSNNWFDVNTHTSEVSLQDLRDMYYQTTSGADQSDVQESVINLNLQSTLSKSRSNSYATMFIVDRSFYSSYPNSYPISYVDSYPVSYPTYLYPYFTQQIDFESNGQIYVVTDVYNVNKPNREDDIYTVFGSTSTRFDKFSEEIRNLFGLWNKSEEI